MGFCPIIYSAGRTAKRSACPVGKRRENDWYPAFFAVFTEKKIRCATLQGRKGRIFYAPYILRPFRHFYHRGRVVDLYKTLSVAAVIPEGHTVILQWVRPAVHHLLQAFRRKRCFTTQAQQFGECCVGAGKVDALFHLVQQGAHLGRALVFRFPAVRNLVPYTGGLIESQFQIPRLNGSACAK